MSLYGAGLYGADEYSSLAVGSLSVTVEIAFTTDPDSGTPAYQDVSAYAMGLSINRGRQYELDTIEASTLTLRLQNDDRHFDPTYTLSPYYPNVIPMRKIRVSATWSGTTYYLFTGFVERWPIQWDAPAWGSVTLTAVDGMAALQNALIAGTFAQAFTGQRISDILSAAAWPSSTPAVGYWTLDTSALDSATSLSYGIPTTLLDTGTQTLQELTLADTDQADALTTIQDAANAERGTFFLDGQGRAVFQDMHHRFNETSQVTFADSAFSSSRLPYTNLVPDYDVTRIVNEVKVTRTGGATQTATDTTSRQNFLRRSLSLTPALTTDAAALDQATFELYLRKDAALRFDSLTVQPSANTLLWPFALGLELGKKVTVEHTTGANSTITPETLTQGCFIEAVSHTVGADLADWQTTFQLSPSSHYDVFFLLDTAQLDSTANAVLAA